MKQVLTEKGITFRSNALAAELLAKYNDLPLAERRQFEAEHGIATTSAEGEDAVGDNGEFDDGENHGDGDLGTIDDVIENENDVPMDERLELAKKEREIVALRIEILAMKRRERLNAAREEAEIAKLNAEANAGKTAGTAGHERNAVSSVQNEVNLPSVSRIEMDGPDGPQAPNVSRQVIDLPEGLRMLPYPPNSERAAIVLPNNDRRPDYRDCEVPKFSGEDPTYDVNTFFRMFENTMKLIRADEARQLLYLRRQLTGGAATLLIYEFNTYDELKAELVKEFGGRATFASIERSMRGRKWKKGTEGLHVFILEMQKFVQRLPAGRLDTTEIIELMVDNMELSSWHDTILRTSPTIDELKKRVIRYETKIMAEVANRAAPRVNSAVSLRPNAPVRPVQTNQGATTRSAMGGGAAAGAETRCYNCSRMGHFKGQCPYEMRPPGVCYKCWQPGHISSACTGRKRFQRLLTEVSAIQPMEPQETEGEQIDFDNPENLMEGLAGINLVSASFRDHLNRYTGYKNFVSLFDTGSPTSFVRRSALPFSISDETTTMGLRGVGGGALKTHGTVICDVRFNGRVKPMRLIILPDDATSMPMILGRDFLKLFGIKLLQPKLRYSRTHLIEINKEGKTVPNKFDPRVLDENVVARIRQLNLLRPNKPTVGANTSQCSMNGNVSLSHFESDFGPEFDMPRIYAVESIENESTLCLNEKLPTNEYNEVKRIIVENYLRPRDMTIEPMEYEMDIHLTSDVPFHYAPRRLSYLEKLDVQRKICEMIGEGIITPSDSPYASAIVLVKKKDGSTRMCVDYRALNKLTVRDNYPLPLIDDCVEYLGGKKFFSLLDLKSGFHQVRVSERSRKYTAFVTPQGQYEYRRMPFGLKNAPAVFQRFVNRVFRDFISSGEIIIYMDDILLATGTWEEHKDLLRRVLRRLASRGLLLNLKKCKFGCEELDYLGYAVSAGGIRPSEGHIEAIRRYPVPGNARELRSCIGLFSYFRRFVHNFSRIARPLQNLLKENVEYNFDQGCKDAFDKLKGLLTSSPILAIYDPQKETELHCDASSHGFGAILLQKQEDGNFHPTAFFSKTTTGGESKYHSFELETMAVLYALERFRVYLEGIKFTIVTDCNALHMALEKRQVNARIARWTVDFSRYTFETRHRPGISMAHVDALSRCHAKKSEEKAEETGENEDERKLTKSYKCQVMAIDTAGVEFRLQVAQNRDANVVKIREKLEKETMEDYEMRDGLVYRRNDGKSALYVPTEMEENVVRMTHEQMAHQGAEKVFNKITEQYWFPRMRTKIQGYITNCVKCIMYAAPVRQSEQNLYCIPKEPTPFDTIHVDHFGPLPALMNKRKHVLVVVDAFTKYVKLFAVNSTSTKEVVMSMEKYFSYYSRPRRIISDRGTCFTSLEFGEFLRKNNVTHVKVATASAQANGQVERVNRVLKSALGKLSSPLNHADWSQKLSQIEYAINNSTHATTGETPSRLLFGINQRGGIVDELTEYLAEKNEGNGRAQLGKIRTEADEQIKRKQRYDEAKRREKCKRTRTFKVGENVVMRNVDTVIGSNKKLIPKFRGPYVIDKTLGNDRYVIKDINGCQLTQLPYDGVVEANKIRRWVTPREVGSEDCLTSESEEGTDEEEEDFRGFGSADGKEEEDFRGFGTEDVDRDDQ